MLLHGFPDDPRVYDGVVDAARGRAAAGGRALPARLRPDALSVSGTPRSGQQAALGKDLLDLLDGLGMIARDACRLRLGRSRGVHRGGAVAGARPRARHGAAATTSRTSPSAASPLAPEREHRLWYQYISTTERGRAGLEANRLRASAGSSGGSGRRPGVSTSDVRRNGRVVRQSGFRRGGHPLLPPSLRARARRSGARGDRARLAGRPPITVPAVSLHGESDGVHPPEETEGTPPVFHRPLCEAGRARGRASSSHERRRRRWRKRS